ncbi:OB-fold nucleic acid binding domain-containing protein [Roseibium aggregatum]|uniref:OB-fold nucleic acid binding domain-containing protein n=1 Tax=Roseibium aggregatum TaxID=187304 RepID=UPI001E2EF44C|nr:OB-fold nucleic acid binding domain-containing protein [Roseibium aggregatum]
MIFLTLEDETGVSNVVVWPKMYEKFRPAVLGGRLLKVTGRLEREGMVVHLIADHIEDRSRGLSLLGHPNDDVLGQTTTKTDDVPVHLKSEAQRPARTGQAPVREPGFSVRGGGWGVSVCCGRNESPVWC